MAISHVRLCCIATLLTAGAGCSDLPSPSAPTPIVLTPVPPSPLVPPPPTVSSALASVVLENAKVIVHKQESYFGYEVRFRLRETAGKSGGTVQNVFVQSPDGGGDNTGPGCWQTPLRVPPSGTLDTFYTDEGARWLSYCAPAGGGNSAMPVLRITVTFTDDQGGVGSAGAIASTDN